MFKDLKIGCTFNAYKYKNIDSELHLYMFTYFPLDFTMYSKLTRPKPIIPWHNIMNECNCWGHQTRRSKT